MSGLGVNAAPNVDLVESQSTYFQNGIVPIAQNTLTGSVVSVTFDSISDKFRHLMLFTQTRTNRASNADRMLIRFNGDTGTNYDTVEGRFVSNNTRSSSGAINQTSGRIGFVAGNTSPADVYEAATTLIFGYKQTDRHKFATTDYNYHSRSGIATDQMLFSSGALWNPVVIAAITSITLLPEFGTNFVSGSIFALYGIS
ncbi:MAG: hypothetical protein V3W20_10505 [Candidatus Neomarinimicrobiota bacterium]